jgi:hypothetical protein
MKTRTVGTRTIRTMTVLALGMAIALAVHAQQKPTPTAPTEDHSAMMKRGDQAMGFSHEKTTHHFRLFKDGGAIEVAANDLKDTASRDEIRQHLSHITQMFAAGNFNVPMLIHDTTPPGVPTMKKLRDQIHYVFQETDSGARVRINTTNPQALEAVHAFLRFQITEHETGDTTEVTDDNPRK